jgi:hypothetical protein
MADGGMVEQPMQTPAVAQTQQALAQDQQVPEQPPEIPLLKPERLAFIEKTASGLKNQTLNIDPALQHPPTEGITSTDIIKSSLTKENYQGDQDTYLRSVAVLANRKKAVLARFSDTVFVGLPQDATTMEVHLFTKDSPIKLKDSVQAGIQMLQGTGIQTIKAETDNLAIINMLKKLPYPLSVQDNEGKYAWSMEITK